MSKGKASGHGELVNLQRKYHYEGQWRDDIPYGYGKENFGDSSYYEGTFSNGIKEGEGLYKKTGEYEYKGNFLNN